MKVIVIRRRTERPYIARPLTELRYARRPYEAMMRRHAATIASLPLERRLEIEGTDASERIDRELESA